MLRFVASWTVILCIVSGLAPKSIAQSDPSEVLGQWEYEIPVSNRSSQTQLFRGIITILEGASGLTGQLREIPIDPPDQINRFQHRQRNAVLIPLTDIQFNDGVLLFAGETDAVFTSKMKIHASVTVSEDAFRGSITILTTQNDIIRNESRTIRALRKDSDRRYRYQYTGK